MEASLITMVVAISSQSDMVWAQSEYCPNSLNIFSSLDDSCFGTLLLTSFLSKLIVFIISSMVVSIDFKSSDVLVCLLFKLYFYLSSQKSVYNVETERYVIARADLL